MAGWVRAINRKRLPREIDMQVSLLRDGSFLTRRENVLAFGNPGSGKSHLLCAIGHELIRQGRPVYFTPCQILVQELLAAKSALFLPQKLTRLGRYDAVIIDDIGYVHQNRGEMERRSMNLEYAIKVCSARLRIHRSCW